MIKRIIITYIIGFDDEQEAEDEQERLEHVLPEILGTEDIVIKLTTSSCIELK